MPLQHNFVLEAFPVDTFNSLYSRLCRDLELVSSVARVRNSGILFQSNVFLFLPGFLTTIGFIGVSVIAGCPQGETELRKGKATGKATGIGWSRVHRKYLGVTVASKALSPASFVVVLECDVHNSPPLILVARTGQDRGCLVTSLTG